MIGLREVPKKIGELFRFSQKKKAEEELAEGQLYWQGASWSGQDSLAGGSLWNYKRMLEDDQIRALVSLKQVILASRKWHFETLGKQPQERECAEFFGHMLHHMQGSLRQTFKDIQSSQVFGFSVLEKIYTQMEWKGETLWGVKALKLRPAESFSFQADSHGNLLHIKQRQKNKPVNLPREKFILHVNRPEVDAHYGQSDLKECWRHYWSKKHILRFWNIYLERMASGFIHGRVKGHMSPSEKDQLRQMMQQIDARSAIITPSTVELNLVTAPPTDAFERALMAHDKAIAKALLVPNLLGFSEQGKTGSYSQSQTQLEAFFFILNSMAESVADVLNEQLFTELAKWNFGLETPPRLVFDPLTENQKMEYVQIWAQAVEKGLVENTEKDESRTRDLLGFPARVA